MSSHAILSASGASRWLTCTPSARLETQFEEVESEYADEGTLAHELAVIMIRHKAGWIRDIESATRVVREDSLYTEEMWGFIEEYAQFVVDKVREAPDGVILLQEHRIDLTHYIPEGFGTVDVGIAAPGILEIVDLKYGKGVPVDAYENKQMMVYALGILEEMLLIYPIEVVRMTIYQPRIENISMYEMSTEDLLKWSNEVLRPTALIAFQGQGDLIAGDHCRWCRVRPVCVANAKLNLQLAKKDFEITQMTDEQISKLLVKADAFKKWITSVEEYALSEAINRNRKWPGLKLVQGKSNRRYTDEKKIIEELVKHYPEEEIVNKKLLGITDMSKKISKLHFKEAVEPYLVKPPGAPTLVSITDKRPEFNSNVAAAIDFKSNVENGAGEILKT